MAATLSDDILIQQALAGEQTAYAALVRRYEHFAFTLAFRMVKNREDAHEVAQDAFLRAFRYLPDFRGDAKFTTWFYKIIYSTALNFLRKQHPDLLSLDDANNPVSLPQTTEKNAAQVLESADRTKAIQQAIAQLGTEDASIITLFYLYENSLDEICQIMDLTMTNAKTKLCRARQRLKGLLAVKAAEVF
jgi:RNA polymerase sigma-70 factor (ECF subfamily)